MHAIEIQDLSKSYPSGGEEGPQKVLDIPEMSIPQGESFGLVGNNGAGKTTMFRCLLDLIRSDTGHIRSFGNDVAHTEDWKRYTGSFLDDSFLIDFLTPDEYFKFIGDLHSLSEEDREQMLARFEELFQGEIRAKKKYIRDLSTGNKKKTGIAAAMLFDPDILVLDEPFSGLDPSSQIVLKDLMKKLKEERGLTMLISSHDLDHVTEVCDRITILDQGRVAKDLRTQESTLEELKKHFAEKTGRRTEEGVNTQ
ncbi:MAG: ABC transporter ATP-binding protein [Flavobacteriales bacterium]